MAILRIPLIGILASFLFEKMMKCRPVYLDEKEKRTLELDARRKLYLTVRDFAGSHYREIERKSNLPTGTVRYHLSFLVRHGLVREERDENNVRYFPREFKPENEKLLGLLRQKRVRDIILFILAHPRCNHDQIVKAVNAAPSTVSWHLKKLKENSIVGFIRKGRRTFYNALIDLGEVVELLVAYQDTFFDSFVDRFIEILGVSGSSPISMSRRDLKIR